MAALGCVTKPLHTTTRTTIRGFCIRTGSDANQRIEGAEYLCHRNIKQYLEGCVFTSSDSGCYPKIPQTGLDKLVEQAEKCKGYHVRH
jgi:hypothetical protein